MNNDINCCGDILIDFEESKKAGAIIYCCQNCGKLYTFNLIGEKERGWKTKQKINNKKFIDSIPF